ncbi:hypothetical protein ABTY98_38765 [Streptomyces sp. NPDC096040]|uniref:hypothetical protein n=1 Tax=Streptomyces sp. NPDC096040 TaxID=3155541 RepID=UPI00331BAC88
MSHYFASPGGALAITGDGPIAAESLPDTWTEITAEEYETRAEAARQAVDEAAAEWIANDGQVPPDGDGDGSELPGIPLVDLRVHLGLG